MSLFEVRNIIFGLLISLNLPVINNIEMTSFLDSFFDDTLPGNYNLWSKESDSVDVSKEKVIHVGKLYKFSKAKNKWKQRHFVLTDKYMLYYKVRLTEQEPRFPAKRSHQALPRPKRVHHGWTPKFS